MTKPEWLFVVLTGVIVVCATIITINGASIPTFFADLSFVAIGAGGGVAVGKGGSPSA